MSEYPGMKDFDVSCFIKCAEELLRADETLRALDLLNNLPAYYRDHVPKEVASLRRDIQKRIATPNFYATSKGYELSAHDDSIYHMDKSLRGYMAVKEVRRINSMGLCPHIVDFAPGEYWLPSILELQNFQFTYFPVYLNHPSYEHYNSRFLNYLKEKPEDNQPVIYFAGEVLEHLHHESELRYEMERNYGLADVFHISTPMYTFDTGCMDWRSKGDLGHLRAYTPKEFMKTVTDMFPEYHTVAYQSQILHARGVLNSTKHEFLNEDIDMGGL